MRLLVMGAAAAVCGAAVAQAIPTEFPADVAAMPDNALRERLAGKTFSVQLANGKAWRLEYLANGYFFVNVSDGAADKGKWHVQDGKVCSETTRSKPTCSEARVKGDVIYVKRVSNGEVIALTPK